MDFGGDTDTILNIVVGSYTTSQSRLINIY